MRKDITDLIDDIKYKSDSLTDLDRLPVIQLNVILAKINTLTKKTTILLHYIEKQGEDQKKIKFSQKSKESIKEELFKEEPSIPSIDIKVNPIVTDELEPNDNIEEPLKKAVVKDLTSAIGINEKYLFASELFNGKIDTFTDAIKDLSAIESLDQAKSYLDNLANQYQWDLENETVVLFKDLVERRYN